MQKLIKSFEDIMVAITFAEAGEYDESRRIAGLELENDAEEKMPVMKAAGKV